MASKDLSVEAIIQTAPATGFPPALNALGQSAPCSAESASITAVAVIGVLATR
jgi:hypothetical protein